MELQKVKNQKRNKRYSLLIFVGIFLLFFSATYFIYDHYEKERQDIKDNEKIEEFFEIEEIPDEEITQVEEVKEEKTIVQKKENYIGILEIPKINLKRGLSQDKYYNNVNRNVEILKGSTMPNISKGNFILAGHSGSGRVAYFRNLNKLTIGDISYIYYGGIKYTYKVNNIYDIEKTGTATITRDLNKTTLTMITCRHNTNKQIVIISELINQESY